MPNTRGREQFPYQNAALEVDARVRDLLARMTAEEKVRQMSMCQLGQFMVGKRFSATAMRKFLGGMSIGCMEDLRRAPQLDAEAVNAVQEHCVRHTRLGIPALIICETLHGHLSDGATVFPQAIALGSTWSPELVRRMAEATAKEARAVGAGQGLAPDLDLAREPRWGRCEETYGEDTYLVTRMGVAYIKGLQGEGPGVDGEHLIATAKHFAAHGSPEGGLNLAPVAGGLRELRTTFFPPFKAAIMEAGALSVMPAYHDYDGIPCSSSEFLLTRVLREEWRFQGYVFSDYAAIALLHKLHKTATSAGEAGRQALKAGMDLEAPADYGFGAALLELVRKGVVSMELIDRALSRILRAKFLAGLFENPYVDVARANKIVHARAHRKLAQEIAQESIILLKNDKKLLPLKGRIKSIAVIGPNADLPQYGDYTRLGAKGVTPLMGIRRVAPKGVKVRHAKGCDNWSPSREDFAEAISIAKESDAAIVVLGDTSRIFDGIEGEKNVGDRGASTCGEANDRSELSLPGVQEDLLRAIYETGTPTILVLIHGRVVATEWIAEKIPAIVEAWYPGEEGGGALADILFGNVNPSGKLTVSIPRSVGHIPSHYSHKPSARGAYNMPGTREAPGRDYVYSSPKPLFAFGHGLSYTKFKYSRLRVTPKRIPAGGCVTVSVDVSNVGKIAGKEAVQLYLRDVVSSVVTPVKLLKRFEKIDLRPGRTKTVTFTLTPDDLMLLDENFVWTVETGEFEVSMGELKRTFVVV